MNASGGGAGNVSDRPPPRVGGGYSEFAMRHRSAAANRARRVGVGGAVARAFALAGALLALAPTAWAGTTGRLSGTVINAKKEPLTGANAIRRA